MKIVTAAEMREIDRRTTEEFGIPSLTLMENAGSAVAEFCLREYPDAKTVGVICGKGNNGGDGFVAARKLHEGGKAVRVLLLADPAVVRGDAAEMLKRLPVEPVIARNEEKLKNDAAQQVFNSDLLIDAILGTGFKPPISDFYRAVIRETNKHLPIVAVDVPSGCDADEQVSPNLGDCVRERDIVSFTAPKPLHVYGLAVGQVVISQIGSPPKAVCSRVGQQVTTAADILRVVSPRSLQAHKGMFGHVLVIGGSRGKAGAAAMAGMAALRAGSGLVTVACPESVLPIISSFAPELMTEPLPETDSGSMSLAALSHLKELLAGKTVVALGPGASRTPETAEFIRAAVSKIAVPLVLDADGLNAFAGAGEQLDGRGRPLILTPHPAEMSRLTGVDTKELAFVGSDWSKQKRISVAADLAAKRNVIVVLKGYRTVIAFPAGELWVNTTGNPGMAKGGSGDILTGIIAACIAQACSGGSGASLEEAVRGGVYLHGLAGDFAAERCGEHSMIATDLLDSMGQAFMAAFQLAAPSFAWIQGAHRTRSPH
jgi:hydroxyethylthiazole kinase-like uncharacterized protein yjeF